MRPDALRLPLREIRTHFARHAHLEDEGEERDDAAERDEDEAANGQRIRLQMRKSLKR